MNTLLSQARLSTRHNRSGLILFLFLSGASGSALATNIQGCFSSLATYDAKFEYDLPATENVAGKELAMTEYFESNGPVVIAQCACPGTVKASTTEKVYSYHSSPLQAGSTTGYGYLTNKLDIQLTAYTDTLSSGTPYPATIKTYPTQTPSQLSEDSNAENTQSVCAKPPAEGVSQRQFKWSRFTAHVYIKSPILGLEPIPRTTILETSVCFLFGSGSCNYSLSQPASKIDLAGYISAPLGCSINAGSAIDVDFGLLSDSNFVTPGVPPKGFALKDVNINFHCDNTAVSNMDRIKLTFYADQGVNSASSGLVAKMIGRDDVGVRMYDDNDNGIRLDGSSEFPIVLDDQGNGNITMKAAPVSTTNGRPAAGKFEGDVTVKMEIR